MNQLQCYRKRPAQRLVAVEGYPVIFITFLLSVLVWFVFGFSGFVLGLAVILFLFFFFRNPERAIPKGEGIAVSPADGKVIEIVECNENKYLSGKATRVSIFMSPLNCHINRAPIEGSVQQVGYQTGTFAAAYLSKAMETNEHHAFVLKDTFGSDWLVVQIAGWLARRIISYNQPGDSLMRGERFGLICFGSRVDLYCPLQYEILVKVGDRVQSGKTVLAKRKK